MSLPMRISNNIEGKLKGHELKCRDERLDIFDCKKK
jgi:hypothetical protein